MKFLLIHAQCLVMTDVLKIKTLAWLLLASSDAQSVYPHLAGTYVQYMHMLKYTYMGRGKQNRCHDMQEIHGKAKCTFWALEIHYLQVFPYTHIWICA